MKWKSQLLVLVTLLFVKTQKTPVFADAFPLPMKFITIIVAVIPARHFLTTAIINAH